MCGLFGCVYVSSLGYGIEFIAWVDWDGTGSDTTRCDMIGYGKLGASWLCCREFVDTFLCAWFLDDGWSSPR
jgi:hypothetical protein